MDKEKEGLTRFTESACFSNKFIKKADSVTLRESLTRTPLKLKEAVNPEETEGWWVPVSYYGKKNGNGRIYGKKLWENVINNQRDAFISGPMLADHPAGDSDGNPKDICGVWLDAKIDPPDENGIGLVWGLLVPSGHLGEDLKDHLRNGLRIGTSSSGFGKLLRDGETVDPDTYQIERLADWVLQASQATYFGYDENHNVIDKSIHESMENTSFPVEDEYKIKESIVRDSKFTKLEEKKFRRDMESFLKDADNIKDPQERLAEFREIRSYFEEGVCSDLKEKVEQKILEEEAEIKKIIEDSIELKEKLGIENAKDLKQKLTKICDNTKLAEKEAKDWKAISEQLQTKLDEANTSLSKRPTEDYVEFLQNRVTDLINEKTSHDKESTKIVKELTEAYSSLKESKDSLDKEVVSLKESNDSLKEDVEYLKSSLSKAKTKEESLNENLKSITKKNTELKESIVKLQTVLDSQRKKFEESFNKMEYLEKANAKLKESVQATSSKAKKAEQRLQSIKSMKEEQFVKDNLTESEEYYNSLYREYGNSIVPFKEKIAGARCLEDAKRTFLYEALPSFKESQDLEKMRAITSLSMTDDEREYSKSPTKNLKESLLARIPKGWK